MTLEGTPTEDQEPNDNAKMKGMLKLLNCIRTTSAVS